MTPNTPESDPNTSDRDNSTPEPEDHTSAPDLPGSPEDSVQSGDATSSSSGPPRRSARPPRHPGVRRGDVWPPADLAALGRLLRPHGIRGEIRVYPYTRTVDELVDQCPDEVILWTPKGGSRALHVESLAAHQNIVLVAFEEVQTRNDAEVLRDAFLCIREEDRWDLQENEYYIDDLAGLDLCDADSGAPIGRVIRVAEGAAHDHLEVAVPGRPRPVLVPFVKAFILRVDLEARRIDARLPEGLLDLDQPATE